MLTPKVTATKELHKLYIGVAFLGQFFNKQSLNIAPPTPGHPWQGQPGRGRLKQDSCLTHLPIFALRSLRSTGV